VVDIYLPDMKFGQPGPASRLTGRADYIEVNRRTVKEMFRQAGFLRLDPEGKALRGLIVRHLILPGGLAGTRRVLEFLKAELSNAVHLSLMAQYYPAHRAKEVKALSRTITAREYEEARELVEQYGFENGWVQELDSQSRYRPDFRHADPFLF
jgi:putative pyruvate formate lyase activating enzyme